MRNVIDILDLTEAEIGELIESARDIIANPDRYRRVCEDKILATLFFEPSTRTRLSFESAMLSLGGRTLGFSEANSSSAAKGESVSDTVRTVACYSDIIAMRHPKEGAPSVAAQVSTVPVINGGDGGHNHPTQTLTDLLTIQIEKNRLADMTVGLCGDLKFGRTVHSLINAMMRYENVRFVLISPPELVIPDYLIKKMDEAGVPYEQVESLDDNIHKLDVLYMTRIQKERFFNEADYQRLKGTYILDREKMTRAKKDLTVMHPLPRVNEISKNIDDDPRAAYFRQVQNGKYIRMALIMKLLGVKS